MIKEGSIIKEAKLGPNGAEVWYKISANLTEIEHAYLNLQTSKLDSSAILAPDWMNLKILKQINDEASKLPEQQKDAYLLEQMQQVVQTAVESYIAFLTLYVRGAQYTEKEELSKVFDYFLYDLHIKETIHNQHILAYYPQIGLRALHGFITKDKLALEKILRAEEDKAIKMRASKQSEK